MSGSVVVLVIGLGGCDVVVDVFKVIEFWVCVGESFGDLWFDVFVYGIFVFNFYNWQFWQFDLVDDDKIDVYCDLEWCFFYMDFFDWQIIIGFGCMLELVW